MSDVTIGFLGIGLLLVLLVLRFPVWAALACSGAAGLTYIRGWGSTVNALSNGPWSTVSSYVLSAVPLFILMGSLAYYSGVTQGAFHAAYQWLGRLRGGLAMTVIAASGVFAATTGSSVASAATMGRVAFPEMKRYNYSLKLGAGAIAAGGLLGIMIPPSIIFIIYASMAEVSVSEQLLAGLFPGLLTILVFMLGISLICHIDKDAGPPAPAIPLRQALAALKQFWGAFVLMVVVIGGIYSGIFTPTESAGVGAFVALIIMVCTRRAGWKTLLSDIIESLISMSVSTAMIFALLIGASIFSIFLSLAGLPQALIGLVNGLDVSPLTVLLIVLALYLPIGMFLDSISSLIVTIPIVLPVIKALEMDPVWFGVLVCLMIEIGLLTPPVGMNVFVVKGTAPPELSLPDVYWSVIPFILMLLLVLALLIAFPEISLWLPANSRGD
ncbi:TRAP transporter large permease [Paracandidimonas soli]|uniref:TRAP transporter large permease protein n=1 Tax=Paracandidimonas soli TaxID=1917182 RepID=A0A4R3V9Q0_9BURK|nr:TRAP transporter large permease [Paracandidimonas soli]TCV00731.1 tripartite ATP-independent transporter DctM subunit [Paracandidimonas soli]